MEATNIVSLGLAPNGVEMFSWFEGEVKWVEFWMLTPGGGLVQARQA